jgi:hypothetical protein
LNDLGPDRSDKPNNTQQQFGIRTTQVAQLVDSNAALSHLVFVNTRAAYGEVNAVAAARVLDGQHAQLPFGAAAFKGRNDVKNDHGLL